MLNRTVITTLSIIIPIVVAILFRVSIKGYDFTFLPPIYAGINAVTAVLLITSRVAIARKNRRLHATLMKTCVGLSALFLVMYILYHMTSEPTPYGGTGALRYLYFVVLISHILLSLAIVPLVLFTLARALRGDFERHRALAKFTFPVWLYVAVTGVVVYLMISPYYA
jgi:putative membrane protein